MIQYSIPYGYNSFANIQKISVLNIISEKLSVTDFKCFLHFNLNDLINGTTALHESAKNNNTKLTEYIICQLNENNINSLDDKGFTPFDYALDLGHFEILKILLKNKSKHDLTKHVFCNLKNIEKLSVLSK